MPGRCPENGKTGAHRRVVIEEQRLGPHGETEALFYMIQCALCGEELTRWIRVDPPRA